jgi:hypothetical protein
MADTDPAAILARYPGPVRLSPSPRKWLLVFFGCAVFVAGGIGLRAENPAVAWLCIGFFGCGVLVAAAMLLPGAGGLVLDADGFEVTNLFRRTRTRWQDAADFTVAALPPAGQKVVVYDNAKLGGGTLGAINTTLSGRSCGLPDTYRLKAQDLAQVMAGWRDRATARR